MRTICPSTQSSLTGIRPALRDTSASWIGDPVRAADPIKRSAGNRPTACARREAEERYPMSKKIMLLALAVVSAALFALPAMASAHENHITGATGKTFKGTGGAGSLVAEGEPTINSVSVGSSGEFTSETTGKVTLEFKESNATILGVKLPCRSAGAASGVITTTNVFHLITVEEKEPTKGKPAILVTPPFPTLICGSGLSERKFQVGGNGVIGTITTPTC